MNYNRYEEVRDMRARVFQETIRIVDQGYYVSPDGERHDFSKLKEMIEGTEFVSRELPPVDCAPVKGGTQVEVVNEDCLEVAERLVDEGYAPALLNMASRRNPGGGVIGGAGAQEETVFRRTDLFKSLYQFASYACQYGLRKSRFQYPLDQNFGGIYTPDVTYFRDSEANDYRLLDNPTDFAVITVAGINRPDLTPDGREIAEYLVPTVKDKMRTIFRLGLRHGCDSLVLGALGCGAFRNPPRHIARLFHEVMEEPEFRDRYRRIVFAILEDHNSRRPDSPEGNFRPFSREFA